MPKEVVSILVVDSGLEVRNLLQDQFQNYHVALAAPGTAARDLLSEQSREYWPDIVVVAQPATLGPIELQEMLGAPGLLERVSVVVFPLLTAPASTATLCRLQTVSNLLQVVRRLALKKHTSPLRAV